MKIGKMAARAAKWLVKKAKQYRANKQMIATAIVQLKSMGIQTGKLEKYMAKLEKIETTIGAHTSAWKKIADAKARSTDALLTNAEVKYLHAFKAAWDAFHKK